MDRGAGCVLPPKASRVASSRRSYAAKPGRAASSVQQVGAQLISLSRATIIGFIEIGQFQNLQAIFSKYSPSDCIDRLGERLDHQSDPLSFSRPECATGERQSGDVHRGRDILGALDQWKCKNDRALVARRQDEFDARRPQRRVATQRKLDRLAGQELILGQRSGGKRCSVARNHAPCRRGWSANGCRTYRRKRVTLAVSLRQPVMSLNAVSWLCFAVLRNCCFIFNIYKRRTLAAPPSRCGSMMSDVSVGRTGLPSMAQILFDCVIVSSTSRRCSRSSRGSVAGLAPIRKITAQ